MSETLKPQTSVFEKLMKVQTALKAPKGQYNEFGKYKYRNCEDILEAVKPILAEHKALIILTDEVVLIGERYYVRATAAFINTEDGQSISNSAYAREEENKKGMDGSQITGASSSYARKYALNGLLAIDDTKDSDTTNKGEQPEKKEQKLISEEQIKELKELGFDDERLLNMAKYYKVKTVSEITYAQAESAIKKQKRAVQNAPKSEVNDGQS